MHKCVCDWRDWLWVFWLFILRACRKVIHVTEVGAYRPQQEIFFFVFGTTVKPRYLDQSLTLNTVSIVSGNAQDFHHISSGASRYFQKQVTGEHITSPHFYVARHGITYEVCWAELSLNAPPKFPDTKNRRENFPLFCPSEVPSCFIHFIRQKWGKGKPVDDHRFTNCHASMLVVKMHSGYKEIVTVPDLKMDSIDRCSVHCRFDILSSAVRWPFNI